MFAQESVMDVQELGQFESVYKPSKEVAFCWLRKQYVQLSTEEDHTEIANHANDSLRIWQAAKAQAVPEGFVLVPKEPTDKTIAHMINTPIEVNLLCDHADTFLSEGEAYIAYKAMIEAQEPAND